MKYLVGFLLNILVFTSVQASCQNPTIGMHFTTHHTDRSANYREDNAGEYFRCENGFTAGSYNNSDWKRSDYVGYSVGNKLNVAFLLISGYQREPIPAIIPSVLLGSVRVSYLPQAPNRSTNTTGWHISFERKI